MTDHVSGKAQQKTITDINPQATSSKLATWGQMTAALSKDDYVKTTRIDRIECDVPKITRVISSLTGTSGSTVEQEDGVYKIQTPQNVITGNPKAVTVNMDSPQLLPFPKSVPYINNLQIQGGFAFYSWRIENRNTVGRITCYFTQNNTPAVGEKINGTIVIPEDQNYAELAVPFEIYLV